jgi:hypothetical protein
MSDNIAKQKKYIKHIFLGDFNARLHGRHDHENTVLGKYIFGKGARYLERKAADREILNRDLLVEVAKENELVVLNTWFDKPVENLYRLEYPERKTLNKSIRTILRRRTTYSARADNDTWSKT